MRFPRRILQIAVLASFFLVAIIFSPSFAAVDPCGDVADGKVDDACTKPYAYKCDGDAECGYYPSMTAEVIPLVCRDLGTGSGVKYCVKEDNAAAKTCSPQYLCGPDGYYRYKKNFDCSQTIDTYCTYGCDAATGTCKASPTSTTIPDSANPTISMYAAKKELKVGERGSITIVGNDDKDVARLSILYNGHSEDYDCTGIQTYCRVEFSQLEFPLGTTTVLGFVNDASGNGISSSITITVSASVPATTTTTTTIAGVPGCWKCHASAYSSFKNDGVCSEACGETYVTSNECYDPACGSDVEINARNSLCRGYASSCSGCVESTLCGWSTAINKCLSAGVPRSTVRSEDRTTSGYLWITSKSMCPSVAPETTTTVPKGSTTTTVPKGGFGDFCTSDSQCLTGKCAIVDKEGGNCVYTTTTTIAAADKAPTASIVSTSSATTASPITLIGIGTDDKDVYRIEAYYQGSWKTYNCEGVKTSCSNAWAITETSPGTYTYYVYVTDSAGQVATTSTTVTISGSSTTTTLPPTTDTSKPTIFITPSATEPKTGESVRIAVVSSDAGGINTIEFYDTDKASGWQSYSCGGTISCGTSWTVTRDTAGTSTYWARVFDKAGNSNTDYVTVKFAAVTTGSTTTITSAADQPPKATIVAPSTAEAGKPFTLIGIGTDDKDVAKLELSGPLAKTYACEGTQTSCSNAWAITETSPGTYTYYVYAYDSIGQMATTSKTVTVAGSTTIASPKGNLGDACYADAQCASGYCDLDKGECAFKPATTTTIYRSVATTTTIAAGGEPRTLIEGALSAPTATKTEGFSLNIQDY